MSAVLLAPSHIPRLDINRWIIVPWFLFSGQEFSGPAAAQLISSYPAPYKPLYYNDCGIYILSTAGGAGLLKVIEELFYSGGREFYFIGSCGCLYKTGRSLYIPVQGFSTQFYFTDAFKPDDMQITLQEYNVFYAQHVNNYLDRLYARQPFLADSRVRICSTQNVYRQTPSLYYYLRDEEVDLIDMETAAFFLFLYCRQVFGMAFQFVSDQFINEKQVKQKIDKGSIIELIKIITAKDTDMDGYVKFVNENVL
ncbi:MAG TPA: hypothetical protein VKS21_10220 [Spirochaetota bacterium]|nr:hypothetical protein [Spirochaetota bacterium]